MATLEKELAKLTGKKLTNYMLENAGEALADYVVSKGSSTRKTPTSWGRHLKNMGGILSDDVASYIFIKWYQSVDENLSTTAINSKPVALIEFMKNLRGNLKLKRPITTDDVREQIGSGGTPSKALRKAFGAFKGAKTTAKDKGITAKSYLVEDFGLSKKVFIPQKVAPPKVSSEDFFDQNQIKQLDSLLAKKAISTPRNLTQEDHFANLARDRVISRLLLSTGARLGGPLQMTLGDAVKEGSDWGTTSVVLKLTPKLSNVYGWEEKGKTYNRIVYNPNRLSKLFNNYVRNTIKYRKEYGLPITPNAPLFIIHTSDRKNKGKPLTEKGFNNTLKQLHKSFPETFPPSSKGKAPSSHFFKRSFTTAWIDNFVKENKRIPDNQEIKEVLGAETPEITFAHYYAKQLVSDVDTARQVDLGLEDDPLESNEPTVEILQNIPPTEKVALEPPQAQQQPTTSYEEEVAPLDLGNAGEEYTSSWEKVEEDTPEPEAAPEKVDTSRLGRDRLEGGELEGGEEFRGERYDITTGKPVETTEATQKEPDVLWGLDKAFIKWAEWLAKQVPEWKKQLDKGRGARVGGIEKPKTSGGKGLQSDAIKKFVDEARKGDVRTSDTEKKVKLPRGTDWWRAFRNAKTVITLLSGTAGLVGAMGSATIMYRIGDASDEIAKELQEDGYDLSAITGDELNRYVSAVMPEAGPITKTVVAMNIATRYANHTHQDVYLGSELQKLIDEFSEENLDLDKDIDWLKAGNAFAEYLEVVGDDEKTKIVSLFEQFGDFSYDIGGRDVEQPSAFNVSEETADFEMEDTEDYRDYQPDLAAFKDETFEDRPDLAVEDDGYPQDILPFKERVTADPPSPPPVLKPYARDITKDIETDESLERSPLQTDTAAFDAIEMQSIPGRSRTNIDVLNDIEDNDEISNFVRDYKLNEEELRDIGIFNIGYTGLEEEGVGFVPEHPMDEAFAKGTPSEEYNAPRTHPGGFIDYGKYATGP